ncbi:aprataxin [Thecamonas trahens ATCC 50062]|uniref:Aprataxin n=1 Tax=Thecamonas trahens ATCC 50062 TaxID=461836 RepID=A0A0L0DXW4_THETB|nr:aprataxin [Thecamonas trahens ATCC 50062]KNC56373.1 aprataxin [Thecamonas trahens ATCC 50062]|eukprot:XP_013760888.1 aprataxin [Thecamonas trahens ATCC 50062]
MYRAELRRVDEAVGGQLPALVLPPGRFVLGRGPQSGIADRTVSRKQATLDFDAIGGRLVVTLNGRNAGRVFRGYVQSSSSSSRTSGVALAGSGGTAELASGDAFALVGSSFVFEVSIVEPWSQEAGASEAPGSAKRERKQEGESEERGRATKMQRALDGRRIVASSQNSDVERAMLTDAVTQTMAPVEDVSPSLPPTLAPAAPQSEDIVRERPPAPSPQADTSSGAAANKSAELAEPAEPSVSEGHVEASPVLSAAPARTRRIDGIAPQILSSPSRSGKFDDDDCGGECRVARCLVMPLLATEECAFGYDPERSASVAGTELARARERISAVRGEVVFAGDASTSEAARAAFARVCSEDAHGVARLEIDVDAELPGEPWVSLGATMVFESNWRFKASQASGGLNARVHALCGPLLARTLKQVHKAGDVGRAYAVQLDESSLGGRLGQVSRLIAVVPPNMNPNKKFDASLDGDYAAGDAKLSLAYRNVLDLWLAQLEETASTTAPPPSVAIDMAGAVPVLTAAPVPTRKSGRPATTGWKNALRAIVARPYDHPDAVVAVDEEVVIIRDKYPKAQHHYLVLPRSSLGQGTLALLDGAAAESLALVKTLVRRGKAFAAGELSGSSKFGLPPESSFAFGFHAIPSMNVVHLHVISRDYDSVSLKNKKHWNSFTSRFFVPASDMVARFEAGLGWRLSESEKAEYRALLKAPLACHLCGQESRNMPQLKAHIRACGARGV